MHSFLLRQCRPVNHWRVFVRYRQPRMWPKSAGVAQLESTCTWGAAERGGTRKKKPQLKVLPMSNKTQKAWNLVEAILPLPNVKEEIYAACDTWLAWELRFPSPAVEKALCILRDMEQWHRVIQVCKWMLSRGRNLIVESLDIFIRALNAENRLSEMQEVWSNLVLKHEESVPRVMCARMIWIYYKRGMPDMALKTFREMEQLNIRADVETLKRVGFIYEQLGFTNKLAELLQRHRLPRKPVAHRGVVF